MISVAHTVIVTVTLHTTTHAIFIYYSEWYLYWHFITGDEVDSDDHQTSIELSSYSLSDNSSHGNVASQPHQPLQDPNIPTHSPTKETCHDHSLPHCSTPLKGQLCSPLQTPATPIHSIDSTLKRACHSSPPITVSLKISPLSSCDDVIDLTQNSDNDSDITYCSSAEGDVYIDPEASLNPTRCSNSTTTTCYSNDSPSLPATDQCMVLPATPEHSTVRTTSIILSYHGVL